MDRVGTRGAQLGGVATEERPDERRGLAVAAEAGEQLAAEQVAIRGRDLTVRNGQPNPPGGALEAGLLGLEIAGVEQETPNAVRPRADVAKHHVLVHDSVDRPSREQTDEVLAEPRAALDQELADDVVGAGRDPERLEPAARARQVADHRPRVVHHLAAEPVAVVPALELGHVGRRLGAGGQLRDLSLGEPERSSVLLLQERADRDVVEPREDALLGDPQDAGQDPLVQVIVVFEPARQEVAQEADDLVVVAVREAGMERRVVLVDQDDDVASGRGVKPLAQPSQGRLRGCTLQPAPEGLSM